MVTQSSKQSQKPNHTQKTKKSQSVTFTIAVM